MDEDKKSIANKLAMERAKNRYADNNLAKLKPRNLIKDEKLNKKIRNFRQIIDDLYDSPIGYDEEGAKELEKRWLNVMKNVTKKGYEIDEDLIKRMNSLEKSGVKVGTNMVKSAEKSSVKVGASVAKSAEKSGVKVGTNIGKSAAGAALSTALKLAGMISSLIPDSLDDPEVADEPMQGNSDVNMKDIEESLYGKNEDEE